MRPASKLSSVLAGAAKAGVTATLCAVMAVPPAMAEPTAPATPARAKAPATLGEQERVLLMLNRFTFGPRPGDVAAVQTMGLEKWFDDQLHPERIDDSKLAETLARYPASQLTVAESMRRFPPPQVLKQLANRGDALPTDPTEHAIYADALANYEAQQKKQAAGATAPKTNPSETQTADEGMMQPAGTAAAAPTDAAKKAKGLKHSKQVEPMDPAAVQAILTLPPDERYQRLLAMQPEESVAFQQGLKPFQRLVLMQGLTPAQTEVVMAMQAPTRVVGAEAMEARLLRDIESNRQLEAVMTDFWLNHFSVYARKNQLEPYMLSSYQRQTILPHALGRFEDLLVATATSPAMMMYLDNWESIGDHSVAAQRVKQVQAFRPNAPLAQKMPKGINENYGRELMELHTQCVNGGYTQQDVIEVAKCLTGWTVDRPYQGMFGGQAARNPARPGRYAALAQLQNAMAQGEPGEFVFDRNRHEPGPKTVLGHTIQENGMKEGLEVLHLLATNPATAHFISEKLAVRFVSDAPPATLVDRMTATWLKTDGDIKAVLTTMVHSPEFFTPAVYRTKVKTPLEFMVSAIRASDAQVVNPLPLVQAMDRLGMPVFGMQTPNGYSWKADEWVSSNALIARMNFALVLAGGRLPGVRPNWPALLGAPNDPQLALNPTPESETQLETVLLGQPAAEKTRETVLAQFANPTVQQEAMRGYNARPLTASADVAADDSAGQTQMQGQQPDAQGNAMLLRANALRARRGGGGGFDAFAAQPATPLGTMAGLLLGSPEFQRR